MKNKIMELHNMMVQGGLTDSAEFLRTNMMKGPGERHNI